MKSWCSHVFKCIEKCVTYTDETWLIRGIERCDIQCEKCGFTQKQTRSLSYLGIPITTYKTVHSSTCRHEHTVPIPNSEENYNEPSERYIMQEFVCSYCGKHLKQKTSIETKSYQPSSAYLDLLLVDQEK